LSAGGATSRRRDGYLAVVEAAYRFDLECNEWLQRLAEAARPILGLGRGVWAFLLDVDAAGHHRIPALRFAGVSAEDRERWVASGFLGLAPPVATPTGGAKEAPRDDGLLRSTIAAVGDAVSVCGTDGDGRALVIGVLLPPGRRLPPARCRLMRQLSVHLSAARRLQRRGISLRRSGGSLEKLFERLQTARHGCSESRENALALWEGLLAGRWSLVDRHDTDGKRLLMAIRNSTSGRDPWSLQPREREITRLAAAGHDPKLIAYELGLSLSTVSGYLTNARRKLGCRRVHELATLLGGWGAVRV
jgi:DNA-binding CsgD family transcriptional regulator